MGITISVACFFGVRPDDLILTGIDDRGYSYRLITDEIGDIRILDVFDHAEILLAQGGAIEDSNGNIVTVNGPVRRLVARPEMGYVAHYGQTSEGVSTWFGPGERYATAEEALAAIQQ